MDRQKKVIYIAGPITGVDRYWEAFEQAEDDLTAIGYIPLSPARLPTGLTNERYARIDMAMLDSADGVLFLEGWANSQGAKLEMAYANYVKKPHATQRKRSPLGGHTLTTEERRAWLEVELIEAFDWAPHPRHEEVDD